MKNSLIAFLVFFIIPITGNAMSCLTVENGKKTLCNDYSNSKKKDPNRLKNLCSAGNINVTGLKIINSFSSEGCSHTGSIAKCRINGFDRTIYYSGDLENIKKGCKFFKKAEFIKL
jgi:hypothetical protein